MGMPEIQNLDETALGYHLYGKQDARLDKQPQDRTRIVTTSWDDGDRMDLKLIDILCERAVCGTFYVPIQYRDRPLNHCDLRRLASQGFEIGAHGCCHKPLLGLRGSELAQEVGPCKQILQDIIGSEVEMFCYAQGRYDANAVRSLQEAGYRGARTVRMLGTRTIFDPFQMPVTLQAFPHGPITYLKNVARAGSLESMRSCLTQIPRLGNWVSLGKALFDEVLANGGVWHLFGHSWEIDRLDLWDDLRSLLDYVAGREGVAYLPNGAVL
jgi:peptidoglycan-N-acetylglucosamine deacetylase